jgi:hypothetical protein
MTPDERQMIDDLFARLAQQASPDKDFDADRLIADRLRRNPDAAYMLVQTALVYEHQMQEQAARIAELEQQLAAQSRGMAPAAGGGSFLGSRIGGQRGSGPPVSAEPVSPWGGAAGAAAGGAVGGSMIGRNVGGSMPSYQPEPMAPRASPGFGGAPAAGRPMPQYQPQAPMGQQPMGQQPMQPAPAQGGGFLRGALATAAGVAGGMMIASSLGSLFGGDQAQAAGSAMSDANATQDELQDAQFEADQSQDEIQDAGFDGGDAGGFDSFDV